MSIEVAHRVFSTSSPALALLSGRLHGLKQRENAVGSISPGPVVSALLADWPEEKLKEAKESGSLLEASEVANGDVHADTATRDDHSRRGHAAHQF